MRVEAWPSRSGKRPTTCNFADDDRVVIIHTDDVGMCEATVSAFADLTDVGLVSSGAVMVPCPCFLHAAACCRQHPGVDMGVHLTLTSEWDSYRWGPISTRDPASGLLDEEGYFHHRSEQVREHGEPEAVERELEQQIARALDAGIDVTHIDTHMGAVVNPRFAPGYLQLALQYRIPPMMLRLDARGWQAIGVDDRFASFAVQFAQQLEAQGIPLPDNLVTLPLNQPEDRLEMAKEAFTSLSPGLTHLIIHPAKDTPELRAATPRTWQARVADYEASTSRELGDYVRNLGVQVIGFRPLRDLMH